MIKLDNKRNKNAQTIVSSEIKALTGIVNNKARTPTKKNLGKRANKK